MSNKNIKRKTVEYYQEQAAAKARKAQKQQMILSIVTACLVLAIVLRELSGSITERPNPIPISEYRQPEPEVPEPDTSSPDKTE